jgi:hypothetical protein
MLKPKSLKKINWYYIERRIHFGRLSVDNHKNMVVFMKLPKFIFHAVNLSYQLKQNFIPIPSSFTNSMSEGKHQLINNSLYPCWDN